MIADRPLLACCAVASPLAAPSRTDRRPRAPAQRSSGAARSVFWLALLGALLEVGCGDTIDPLGEGGDADFDTIYESAAFQECGECHAPDAPGRTADIERTQDWSTVEAARRTLRGNASGLVGNFAGCNGVPLLGSTAEQSLLVASLDSEVRSNFELAAYPECTGDAISDQTMKIGVPLPASVLQDLKDWIDAGTP